MFSVVPIYFKHIFLLVFKEISSSNTLVIVELNGNKSQTFAEEVFYVTQFNIKIMLTKITCLLDHILYVG